MELVLAYTRKLIQLWGYICKKLGFPDGLSTPLVPFYRATARAWVYYFYKVNFIGFEKIPHTGPMLLLSNHVSYVDGVIVQAGIKRNVRYLIDGNIYNLPGVHYFMRLAHAIPIFPKRDSVLAAFDEISAGLRAGDAVCIFPEGQLTYTGSLGRFRTGIESIIKRDPVPVYPIVIQGMWGSVFSRKYLKSRFRWWPRMFRRRHVKVICGDPIPPENVKINNLQQAMLALKYSI